MTTKQETYSLRLIQKHFSMPKLHQKKILVTVRWSTREIIQYKFLNPGKTIKTEKYCQKIRKKQKQQKKKTLQHNLLQHLCSTLVNKKNHSSPKNNARISQVTLQKLNISDHESLPAYSLDWGCKIHRLHLYRVVTLS